MDLFDLMIQGREDKALDRLEGILAQYESENEAEQDEALERARSFCDLEWGSYPAGLEALARRWAVRQCDGPEAAMQALRLHEEGARPGAVIRAVRLRRLREAARVDDRARVLESYGDVEAVFRPTAFEAVVIEAVSGLGAKPSAESIEAAAAAAHPLPADIQAARAECLRWEGRLRDMELVGEEEGASDPVLPPACAARHRLVERLWNRTAPVRSPADFAARLEYWSTRAAGDESGYAVLAADFNRLEGCLVTRASAPSTKDRARALRQANPDWSLARIGKELGISRQAVHKHLRCLAERKGN